MGSRERAPFRKAFGAFFSRMFSLGARSPSGPSKRLLAACSLIMAKDPTSPILRKKKTEALDALRIAWAAYARKVKTSKSSALVRAPARIAAG